MKSIVERLGTEEFKRIRIGTGYCEDKSDLINYVLSKLKNDEYIDLVDGINIATDEVCKILKNGNR